MPLAARRLLDALGGARLGRGLASGASVGRTQAHREGVALASSARLVLNLSDSWHDLVS